MLAGPSFRLLRLALRCLPWLGLVAASAADVVVIVHPDNPVQTMTPRQVSDFYLGRSRSFGAGDARASLPALIYELPPHSPLRESFFRSLNGMSLSQLNAYWARLRFSGEVLPPLALPDSRAVVEAVSRDRSAIGYVDASALSASVKTVLRLKD